MCACLVGDNIGANAARMNFGKDIGCVAKEADRLGLARRRPAGDHFHGFIKRIGALIEVFGAQAEVDAVRVALDREAACARKDGGERLRAAHAAEAACENPFAFERAAVVLAACFGKGFVCALDDALGSDVDPASCCHLAVHHEALFIELVEVIPIGPVRDEV